MQIFSDENEFDLHENESIDETHFRNRLQHLHSSIRRIILKYYNHGEMVFICLNG